MPKSNSLVGELRLGETRKLDKGCTEKEAAHNLLGITGAATAHASFWDTSHRVNVQKVLEFSIEYMSKWSELSSALTAAAVMLPDMAAGEGSRGASEQPQQTRQCQELGMIRCPC